MSWNILFRTAVNTQVTPSVGALGLAGGSGTSSQVATVIQFTIKDPALGNRDAFFNTNTTSTTSPTTAISQAGYISGNIAGNALLCIACMANDFGTGPDPAGNTILSVSDPVNGDWGAARGEVLANTNDCNADIKVFVKFNAQPLLSTSWTGTAAVSAGGVLTLGSGSGPFRLGQRINSASTPAVGVTGGETVVVSKLSGTLGAAGSTYQLGGGIGATTFTSQAMTTTDIVAVQRNQTTDNAGADFADYPGIFLVEVAGTDGSTVYFGGALQSPGGSGSNTVTTGNVSMASLPGLFFGYVFNGGVGAGGAFAADAGTGFTNSQKILNYDEAQPICTVEWQHFSSLGSRAATASPHAASNYAIAAVGFLDHA